MGRETRSCPISGFDFEQNVKFCYGPKHKPSCANRTGQQNSSVQAAKCINKLIFQLLSSSDAWILPSPLLIKSHILTKPEQRNPAHHQAFS